MIDFCHCFKIAQFGSLAFLLQHLPLGKAILYMSVSLKERGLKYEQQLMLKHAACDKEPDSEKSVLVKCAC